MKLIFLNSAKTIHSANVASNCISSGAPDPLPDDGLNFDANDIVKNAARKRAVALILANFFFHYIQ